MNKKQVMVVFMTIIIAAGYFLFFGDPTKSGADPADKTEQSVSDVQTGTDDTEPPMVDAPSTTWKELFDKVGSDNSYWECFERQTGHNRLEALDALKKESEGWNVVVTLVSNTDVAAGDQALDSKGLTRDPDVVQLDGFVNTRKGCEAFDDERSQVRVALTLPGPDPVTAGLPVVLGHCGNILPQDKTAPPPPPAVSIPKPNKPRPTTKDKPTDKVTTAPPATQPPGTQPPGTQPPATVPPTTASKCANQTGTYCGTPDSGPEFIPVQENDPALVAPTPGYKPGNAETIVTKQTPKPGADPYKPTPVGTQGTGAGGQTPVGQTNTPTGPVNGGTTGASNGTNTEGSNQTSSGDPGSPP